MNRKAVKARKYRVFVLLQWIVVVIISGASVCLSQEQKKSLGELKIQGSHIESLVLRSLDDWHTETFNEPFEASKIPVGKYRLQNIRLKGDYYCGTKPDITVSIVKDESATFKVGTPLKHSIDVKRQGRVLILSYKLFGMAGENYSVPSRDNPPGFSIFKDNKEIYSDNFEFG